MGHKGSDQTSGFSGRTVGKMLQQKRSGSATKAPTAPKPKKGKR